MQLSYNGTNEKDDTQNKDKIRELDFFPSKGNSHSLILF